jgi:hypothetical protein
MAVVVVDEDAEHALEVPAVEDEEPVEALRADGADEALGDRIRFGARTGAG